MANARRRGPAGSAIKDGKDGLQVVTSKGHRWTEEAEAIFFAHLALTCNVTQSAAMAGFSATRMFQKRRNEPDFARKWQAAIDQGHARLEALLVQRAIETLEGFAPDADTPVPAVTFKDAMSLLGHHRARVEGGPRSRRSWARPRSLDEVRDAILAKLEAIAPAAAPSPTAPAADLATDLAPGDDA